MSLKLSGTQITIRESDNFVNATQICKAGGARFSEWFRLDATKRLIQSIKKKYSNLCLKRIHT